MFLIKLYDREKNQNLIRKRSPAEEKEDGLVEFVWG